MLLAPLALHAQNKVETFSLEKVELTSNTAGTPSLTVLLKIAIDNGTLDPGYYATPANRPGLHIDYSGTPPACPLITNFTVGRNSVGVTLTNLTQETVERFLAKDNKISVQFDDDLVFEYTDNAAGAVNKFGRITKDAINKKIGEELSFPAEQRSSFLTSMNNMYFYKNNVDFGVQTAQDSSSVSYTLSFNFQNMYGAPSLLTCDGGAGSVRKKWLLYYGVSSRLSTNFKDSLNFLNVYPLILNTNNYAGKIPYEWNLKVGHESNQSFTNRRIAADMSFSSIIPNLVDVASAGSSRLRLKPVLGLGLKGYYDYSKDNPSSFYSGQAYATFYYYIPIYDHFAIILNDKTYYDFSKEKNPKKQVLNNYSVALGTEIPKTGFKLMFKYENGKSDINFKQSQALVIGVLMNLFSDQVK